MELIGEGVFVLGSFKRSDLMVTQADLKVLAVKRVSPDCIEVMNAGDYIAQDIHIEIYPGGASDTEEVVAAWQGILQGRSEQVQLPEELISEPDLRVEVYYNTLIPNPRIADSFSI